MNEIFKNQNSRFVMEFLTVQMDLMNQAVVSIILYYIIRNSFFRIKKTIIVV